ncbi:unnamed protein product [Eretmochelys imbricata]
MWRGRREAALRGVGRSGAEQCGAGGGEAPLAPLPPLVAGELWGNWERQGDEAASEQRVGRGSVTPAQVLPVGVPASGNAVEPPGTVSCLARPVPGAGRRRACFHVSGIVIVVK